MLPTQSAYIRSAINLDVQNARPGAIGNSAATKLAVMFAVFASASRQSGMTSLPP